MALDPKTLTVRIDNSFGAMSYPGDELIVRDNSGSDLESERVKAALKGRHWRDVSFETLERLRSALPFLSGDGYRFYIPAFMVLSIIDFERAGDIADEVVRSLTMPLPADVERIRELAAEASPALQPFDAPEWDQVMEMVRETFREGGVAESTFSERVGDFDAAQASVIREFLEYLRDVHGDEFPDSEPETALERYWARRA